MSSVPARTSLTNLPTASFHVDFSTQMSGTINQSILNEDSVSVQAIPLVLLKCHTIEFTFLVAHSQGWRPAITVKQILVGIQDLLDLPNPTNPVQTNGCHFFVQDRNKM